MKASQRDFNSVAARAAASARVFYFCGADEAGAQDAAAAITARLADPGERIELSGAELRKDPVRLADEARSTSLFGGARHIFVRTQGDEAFDAVANLLDGEVEPCPVLLLATGATDKSRIAKLLADRGDALVAMFHPPDLGAVTQAVRRMAGAAGLRIDDAIAQRLARAANLDTRIAQSEIAKLALYLDVSPERPGPADVAALEAISAQTEEDGFAPLVNAVLGGASDRLASELRRVRELRLSAVGVLLACERRAAQLASLAAKLGPGGDIRALLKAERVFWKEEGEIAHQLRIWRGKAAERLVTRLLSLHRQMLGDSQSADMLLDQGLTDIARAAARRS